MTSGDRARPTSTSSARSGLVKHGSGTSFSTVSVIGRHGVDQLRLGRRPAATCTCSAANGLILHGSAADFSKGFSPTGDYLNYGWGTPGSADVWIPSMNSAGTASTLWHSADHGVSWQSQMTTASPLWAVWASNSGDAFVVGDQILESTDGGAHWTMAGTTPQILFGVGGDAGRHRRVEPSARWAPSCTVRSP